MMHSNLQDVFGEPLNSRVEWEPVTLSSLLAVPPCYGTMIKPHVEPDGWLDLRVLNIQEGRRAYPTRSMFSCRPTWLNATGFGTVTCCWYGPSARLIT